MPRPGRPLDLGHQLAPVWHLLTRRSLDGSLVRPREIIPQPQSPQQVPSIFRSRRNRNNHPHSPFAIRRCECTNLRQRPYKLRFAICTRSIWISLFILFYFSSIISITIVIIIIIIALHLQLPFHYGAVVSYFGEDWRAVPDG